MGDTHRKRRRVFVKDTRGEGRHLRATWHAERRTFVVSTWIGEVCTGAVRLPANEAPELVSLIVDGLAEIEPERLAPPPPPPAPPDTPAAALAVLRRWLATRVAGTAQQPPATHRNPPAVRKPTGDLPPGEERRTA